MISTKVLMLWQRLGLQRIGIKSGVKEKSIQIAQALISRFRLLKSRLYMIVHKIQQFQIIKEEKESISDKYFNDCIERHLKIIWHYQDQKNATTLD